MFRSASIAVFGAATAVVAIGAYYQHLRPGARLDAPAQAGAAGPLPSAAVSGAAPGTLRDPLSPDRPLTSEPARSNDAEDWVSARPAFQASRSVAERGGAEPCATPEGDTSAFDDWVPLSQGHFSAPRDLALDASGGFDLVIHLLGDGPVRRELVLSGQRFVLYTVTLPLDQSYAPLFSGSQGYDSIRSAIEQSLRKSRGKALHVRHVAMSAWSAGFVGIAAAISQPFAKDIGAVLLIDGLHAPRTDREQFKAQLKPFVDYARLASAGERFMFISHSSIDPPGFASTTESAHYLINELGGKPQAVKREDPLGLELVELFTRGDLHVRGYAGNDKADHCAQLATLRDAYTAVGRRWAALP